MILLPIDFPEIDSVKMNQIEIEIRAIYRLITFSRKHLADDLGGNGANFMIDWYSNKPIKPLFQCVMIGGLASRTFSFVTQGQEVD